jgi:hypothetical protein
LYGGNEAAATTAGIVSHQKMPRPATPARTARRKSRFNIHQSVIERYNPVRSLLRHHGAQYERNFGRKLPSNFGNSPPFWE